MKRFAPSLLLISALPLLVGATSQDTVLLRLKVAAGTKQKITTTTTSLQELSGMMERNSNTSVKSVNVFAFEPGEESKTKVVVTTEDFTISSDQDTPGMDPAVLAEEVKSLVVTMSVDERGLVLTSESKGGGELSASITAMESASKIGYNGIIFPEESVKIGSQWKHEVDLSSNAGEGGPLKMSGGKIPSQFELVGFEELNGKKAAKIKITMKGRVNVELTQGLPATGTMDLDTNGHFWIDLATGLLLKAESKVITDIDLSMIRVKSTANSKVVVE
ncbi:hypothetical protein QPK87_01290 [Kamptonema cortianum]|nr:hypothetical protein [Geitlerinema splendidum]MDK3155222.1 hypothetical protein [Kamptonema cortianum]